MKAKFDLIDAFFDDHVVKTALLEQIGAGHLFAAVALIKCYVDWSDFYNICIMNRDGR